MGEYRNKRQRYEILKQQLVNERSTFEPHWRDLADYILPRRTRFFVSDANKGNRRNQKIIDTTPTLAARALRSGMMSGITSPARPWFKLSVPDPTLSEFDSVKFWLHTITQRMATIFTKSNLYNVLPAVYGDLGVFATSAMSVEEDADNVIRAYSFPIGSYAIANDHYLRVRVFFREFQMTVRQVIDEFARREDGSINWDILSSHVKHLWESDDSEAWIEINHFIESNPDYDPKKADSKYKKFKSVYFEQGISSANSRSYLIDTDDKFLRESGFDYFPVLCPRWEVTGEDVYGTSCPGMEVLGDIKQLQVQEKRAAQAIEKMVNPPMVGSSFLKKSKASILPGDITYDDTPEGRGGFRPAHEVNFRIQELEGKQEQIRGRIRRAFYEDLFLMLATSDRREITAREIEERHEEKLLALGPVLEQLNQDLLEPLIDITFDIMLRQGLVPEPPEEIQGAPLKIEFISIMAQAQKIVGLGGIDRFTQYASGVASVDPRVLDKINADQLIDVYGDITSIPPGIVRSDEEVENIRRQRAQAEQRRAQMEMLQQGAGAAKDLSSADTSGENALTGVLNTLKAQQ